MCIVVVRPETAFCHACFFIYLDRLSDILRITEIVCTLDGRVMNKLRIVYDLAMLSPSGKDI